MQDSAGGGGGEGGSRSYGDKIEEKKGKEEEEGGLIVVVSFVLSSSTYSRNLPTLLLTPTQILTNLRNALLVWGVSSPQYRACQRIAVEYLNAGGGEEGCEGEGEGDGSERELVARLEGLRVR